MKKFTSVKGVFCRIRISVITIGNAKTLRGPRVLPYSIDLIDIL